MTLQTTCAACGQPFDLDVSGDAVDLTCPHCGTADATSSSAIPPVPVLSLPDPPRRPSRRRAGPKVPTTPDAGGQPQRPEWAVVGTSIAAALVFAFAVVAFLAWRSRPSPTARPATPVGLPAVVVAAPVPVRPIPAQPATQPAIRPAVQPAIEPVVVQRATQPATVPTTQSGHGSFFGVPVQTQTNRSSGGPVAVPPVVVPPAPSGVAPAAGPVVSTSLLLVADDFVVDVYVNGQPLPQPQRHLKGDLFGAQVEQDDVDLHVGDWVVFNVVSNGLRWNGSRYFAAAGVSADGSVAFETETDSHRWSACDTLGDVPRFVADPAFGADRPAIRPAHVWGDGDKIIRKRVNGWAGAPVWGTSHSSWIKFVIPAPAAPADKRDGHFLPP